MNLTIQMGNPGGNSPDRIHWRISPVDPIGELPQCAIQSSLSAKQNWSMKTTATLSDHDLETLSKQCNINSPPWKFPWRIRIKDPQAVPRTSCCNTVRRSLSRIHWVDPQGVLPWGFRGIPQEIHQWIHRGFRERATRGVLSGFRTASGLRKTQACFYLGFFVGIGRSEHSRMHRRALPTVYLCHVHSFCTRLLHSHFLFRLRSAQEKRHTICRYK